MPRISIEINGIPLEDLETGENFKAEANRHALRRKPIRPKPRSPRGRASKVYHWTRDEIREVYGIHRCPYTWEEITEKIKENIIITFSFNC